MKKWISRVSGFLILVIPAAILTTAYMKAYSNNKIVDFAPDTSTLISNIGALSSNGIRALYQFANWRRYDAGFLCFRVGK